MTLYDFELDDQCYKVRLLLGLLNVDCERVAVNMLPGREQTAPPLSTLNPLGTLPTLVDGDLVLHEAEPILCYLARAHDPAHRFLPDSPARLGAIMVWLHFAIRELGAGSLARQQILFGDTTEYGGVEEGTRATRRALRVMEDHMVHRGFEEGLWFVGGAPSLADVAVFPAAALSRDLGVEHEGYPALRRWMRRVRALPGFVTMPGVPDYH